MDPENFRKKKLHNGKRSAAVLLVQYQFARRHFPPVRSRIHVHHFKSLLLDTQESKQTHPETLHLAYPKWRKEHVPNKKTPNLKGRTTNGQNWRHITVYKHCFCYSNFYGVEQKNLLLGTNPLPFIRSDTFQRDRLLIRSSGRSGLVRSLQIHVVLRWPLKGAANIGLLHWSTK